MDDVMDDQHGSGPASNEASADGGGTFAAGSPHEVESRMVAAGTPPDDAAPPVAHADEPADHEPVAEESAADESAEAEPIEDVEEPPRGPIEETPIVDEPPKMNWYILKVQSNREDSIRDSLQRRV